MVILAAIAFRPKLVIVKISEALEPVNYFKDTNIGHPDRRQEYNNYELKCGVYTYGDFLV